jgi:hypothetical protein
MSLTSFRIRRMLPKLVKSFENLEEVKKIPPRSVSHQNYTQSLSLQVTVKRDCQWEQVEAGVVTALTGLHRVPW